MNGFEGIWLDVQVKIEPKDIPEWRESVWGAVAVISNNEKATIASIRAGTPRIAITRFIL